MASGAPSVSSSAPKPPKAASQDKPSSTPKASSEPKASSQPKESSQPKDSFQSKAPSKSKGAPEPKTADTKATDQKAADTKATDQKAADTKATDQKAADTKAADQKAADQKAAQQKAAADQPKPAPADTKPANQPPPGQQQPAEKPQDAFDAVNKPVTQAAKGVKTASTLVNEYEKRVVTNKPRQYFGFESSKRGQQTVSGANNARTRIAGPAGIAGNAAQLPGAVVNAGRDINKAWNDPNQQNVEKALASTSSAAKTALSGTKDTLTTIGNYQNHRKAYDTALKRFQQEAPEASKEVAEKVARIAADGITDGTSKQLVRNAAREVGDRAGGVAAAVAREALEKGGSSVAKLAGRFTPGANVAIAALDTYQAVQAWRDPEASTSKALAASVTALGSIAAATNVPIVSQIGAGVSTVSSLLGAFL